MTNYTPEEVDMLIEKLKDKVPKPAMNIPRIPLGEKRPFLNKTERTIRYLEQRHKFFNPTKKMLGYIINIVENSGLDANLVKKMKEDLLTKR